MDAGAPRRGGRARPRGPRQEPQVPAPRARGFGARSRRRLGGERAAPPTRPPGGGLGPAATPAPGGGLAAAPRRPGSPCASSRLCAPEFTRQPRRWLSIHLGSFGVRRRAREEGDGRRCRNTICANFFLFLKSSFFNVNTFKAKKKKNPSSRRQFQKVSRRSGVGAGRGTGGGVGGAGAPSCRQPAWTLGPADHPAPRPDLPRLPLHMRAHFDPGAHRNRPPPIPASPSRARDCPGSPG